MKNGFGTVRWFGKGKTGIVVGVNTNTDFTSVNYYAGLYNPDLSPVLSYNPNYGLGMGNVTNPGSTFYYPSYNPPSAESVANKFISNANKPQGQGDNFKTKDGRGTIVSFCNLSAAYGYGGTFDMGSVSDNTGDAKMYLTIGLVGGYGASAGVGISNTNKNFRVDNYAGGCSYGAFTILGLLGGEISGDWKYGRGLPGSNTRVKGANLGIGFGYFGGYTYTILAPIPPSDIWCRPGMR